ncbi:MAG: amino acid ABC transporter substrate-binding protein [Candidatus Entotheonella factor]|uniref:Amino acid ABC transporter substrate-binding protein n=1 Tax=Entotheonella factor TaxID=1429438 RepID=W4LKD2_ENTF1|nr:amino acid ABC transporter substrate-binding protein [Candidatus Entotheonella palauensis]ETW98170.1 MAG: amino acid ABC transporter substrate-binding protein [Candidatus Entotheonella factor]
MKRFLNMTVLLGLAAMVAISTAHAGKNLDAIKASGTVKCGVSTGLAGFSIADSKGNYTGLDADFCKALAAAVLGDASKVTFVPLSAQQRFTALQSGEVDLLSRNTTWTLTRDASLGLVFAGVTFYDGQGFMVPKEIGVSKATELDGAEVCVQTGTTTELNLADYFRAQGMTFKPVVFENLEESKTAFFNGRCQVYTTDRSGLASIRAADAPNPDDYVILPETISKEPLGPVVRRGDDEWFTIVKWMVYGLIEAEEKGVTSKNVDEMKNSQDPVIKRLLGVSGDMGTKIGLDNDWVVRAIKAIGNYGEVYDRNVVPIGLPREGSNALWTKGGLMYAMPLR